jgi:hypothetical protein
MADHWKPDYIDLDSGAWLASKTRRRLRDPRLWGIYWEIIHLLNEAGGRVAYDREDLLETTLATPEELDRVLELDHFEIDDENWLTHRVVTAKIDALRKRLGKSSEGGIQSGRVRRAKAEAKKAAMSGTPFEPPSEPVPKGARSRTDLLSDLLTDGSSQARASEAPEVAAPDPPGQIKPGAQRAQDQNPGQGRARPIEPGGLTEARARDQVQALRPPQPHERDPRRPWLTRSDAAWFDRQRLDDQAVFGNVFFEVRGYDIDHGPPKPAGGARAQ